LENDYNTRAQLEDQVIELKQSYGQSVEDSIAAFEMNREKIQDNNTLYYNEKKDMKERKHYYKSVVNAGGNYFSLYHRLIKRTHKRILPYFISKDQFLYTWVDMHPDGAVKSIYSGEKKDPKTLIKEDYATIKNRFIEFQQLLKTASHLEDLDKKVKNIETEYKFNTEHIVPVSWYGGKEPMKGDLHHLFVCQPECNTIRSNFPYDDFSFYVPESPNEQIQNRCGIAKESRFEPEDGKGAAARAMLYFLLRYPGEIKKSFRRQIDLSLLIYWHKKFEVTLYEKHRNLAIYRIQGNRNPFIDFPDLAEKMRFRL